MRSRNNIDTAADRDRHADRAPVSTSGTFSIVAADPDSGACGAAVASKFPAVGQVVPFVRAGVGAFCTQHYHRPEWGDLALDLLEQGMSPESALGELLRDDEEPGKRQLAIIDIHGRAANRNPAAAAPSGIWWGGVSGRFYACQGNMLVGRDVVFAMAAAFEDSGSGDLGERLMAALKAGDEAGGDHRGRLAAGLRLVRPASESLDLDVDESDTAVADLARLFETA